MNYYTLNAIYNFVIDNSDKIKNVKITHFERYGFNEMEGGQYQVNFKIETLPKYKNKLLKVLTNSSYLQEYEGDTVEEVKDVLEDSLNAQLI